MVEHKIRFWFIESKSLKKSYDDAYDSITQMNMWAYIKNHKIKSFLLYPNPVMRQLYKLTIKNCILHNNTYEHIMYNMRQIAIHGYYRWEMMYIKRYRPDLYVAGKTINRIIFYVLSSPYYKKGKERITKMFEDYSHLGIEAR